jgi:hypothetical protein
MVNHPAPGRGQPKTPFVIRLLLAVAAGAAIAIGVSYALRQLYL